MEDLECKNCSYYWKEDYERYPTCHYDYDPYYAPCEEREREKEYDSYYDSED